LQVEVVTALQEMPKVVLEYLVVLAVAEEQTIPLVAQVVLVLAGCLVKAVLVVLLQELLELLELPKDSLVKVLAEEQVVNLLFKVKQVVLVGQVAEVALEKVVVTQTT